MSSAVPPPIHGTRDLSAALGFSPDPVPTGIPAPDSTFVELINLRLAALGQPTYGRPEDYPFLRLSTGLLADLREMSRLLDAYLSPVDQRLQDFLDSYLADLPGPERPRLPARSLVLDRHGLARTLSLPPDTDRYDSALLQSYRLHNGILHNPVNDRRTTAGVFHVTEGGLPIPADKKAVPKLTFARLLAAALNPPEASQRLPFTSTSKTPAHVWVTLLLRPVVVPAIPGNSPEQSMEVRFFAPGSLVANLDFVESIFGNAGDPFLPSHDSALDVVHWTGHTGGVILAPHLVHLKKKDLGLPHWDDASERQRQDGMCWKNADERYNDGGAFKITARDSRGVIVTVIADNYFGYCKKEVKTQISFAANLYGMAEEEHAGGTLAFPRYDLGEDFQLSTYFPVVDHTFAEALELLGDQAELQPDGYALDREFPNIVYLPENVRITLADQRIVWTADGGERTLRLLPDRTYVLPSGYKVEMIKPAEGRRWRLTGTNAEGTFCHKPSTVSGGGKSEISKSIGDAIIHGPVFVSDFQADFDFVEALIGHDYSQRFLDSAKNREHGRPILGTERSLGSVIKLFTPSDEYTPEYNAWLATIPAHVKELLLIVKRFWKPDWGTEWRSRFSVDSINGRPGNELKYRNLKLIASYLRVGYLPDGSWRVYGLRKDFLPAAKLQEEDDISAAAVVPSASVKGLNPNYAHHPSVKFIRNCEYRFFQRPDDAIVRGYDKQTERDLSHGGNFLSNYEPIDRATAKELVEDSIRFEQYTAPLRDSMLDFAQGEGRPGYIVSCAHPRIVDGKPSKNPRYLQTRADVANARPRHLSETALRLFRRLPSAQPVPTPVNAVLPGRRNNPPEPGVRPLCVFSPIHYLELPELFMEFIASMTGRSPSTTGAGSEGALTKGPFNALPPIVDLNDALVSFLVTGHDAFVTCAGHVGPNFRVDHDVSLLVPEVWSRMRPDEREPAFLIRHGYLEKLADVTYEGRTVPSSRLGWRITAKFVNAFFGRVFSNPDMVFPSEMLHPETQDMAVFVEGVENICVTHERVAKLYFEDGSVEMACPPLRALLELMATGKWQGKTASDPEFRALFDRSTILHAPWYRERLAARQQVMEKLLHRHIATLENFLARPTAAEPAQELGLAQRLENVRTQLIQVTAPGYTDSLAGTIGTDPSLAAK